MRLLSDPMFQEIVNIYLNAKVSQHLLKCLFLLFDPKFSLDNNAIDNSSYLLCIQHENQSDMINGRRALTRILRQPPILKVTKLQYLVL